MRGRTANTCWAALAALAVGGGAWGQPPPAVVVPDPPARDAQPLPDPPGGPVVPPAPAPTDPPADGSGRSGFREPPLAPGLPAAPQSDLVLPNGARVTLPGSARQQIRFSPRYGQRIDYRRVFLDRDGREDASGKGEGGQRVVLTGGIIVNVVYQTNTPGDGPQEVEFATDRAVAWISSKEADAASGVQADGRTKVDVYLEGNVVIRRFTRGEGTGGRNVDQILRAKEVWYDISRNRAVALDSDIELRVQNIPDPLHLKSQTLFQYSPNEIEVNQADIFSSKRPAAPGLKISTATSTLTRGAGPRRNFLGLRYRDLLTLQPTTTTEQTLTSERVRVEAFDVPFLFFPRTTNDLNEPFGPLAGFGIGNDQVFGAQVYTTFDLLKILALVGPPGHRWNVYADYLSFRGPGFGTRYDYQGRDLLGLAGKRDVLTGLSDRPEWDQPFNGFTRLYTIDDKGVDNLGPDRNRGLDGTIPPPKPDRRGRAQWQHNGDLFEDGVTFVRLQAQAEYLSDVNFLEQYYKQEFDLRMNQETFLHLQAGSGNLWGSFLVQPNVARPWVTETESLPRADAALLGQDLGPFQYTAKANAGYYRFRPADPNFVQPSFLVTEQQDADLFRGNVFQRLSLPLDAGPFRVTPYGVMDLAYYGETLTGDGRGVTDGRGRFYGGGGATVGTTLSRLFPDARSELFNVAGINHKLTLGANYYNAGSDLRYTRLPLLDRLNDDATDQGYRQARTAYLNGRPGDVATRPDGSQFRLRDPFAGTAEDNALATSPIFDPQQLAIRRLLPDKVDTLDRIEVLQLEARNRWQTKRGFPGREHVVDWLALDLRMSVFPDKDRDNFGESTGQYMYNAVWNVGDRTTLYSSGWYDPFEFGPRYVQVGGSYNRPDNTVYFLTYRHTDPINSRTLGGGLSVQLGRKYTASGGFAYDFGQTENQTLNLNFARVGTDVTFLFGFTYNALVQNFGFQFSLVPNLAGISAGQLAGVSTGGGTAGNRR